MLAYQSKFGITLFHRRMETLGIFVFFEPVRDNCNGSAECLLPLSSLNSFYRSNLNKLRCSALPITTLVINIFEPSLLHICLAFLKVLILFHLLLAKSMKCFRRGRQQADHFYHFYLSAVRGLRVRSLANLSAIQFSSMSKPRSPPDMYFNVDSHLLEIFAAFLYYFRVLFLRWIQATLDLLYY